MLNPRHSFNGLIRKSAVMELGEKYPQEVSEAIGLAIHPWPDCELSQEEIDELVAELLPRRNVNHHSTIEIAIDRLLRLASCFDNFGRKELASDFQTAANRLEEFESKIAVPTRIEGAIANPIGLDPGALQTKSDETDDSGESFVNQKDLQLTVAQMFGAAESTGAFDLGELFGGKPTGIKIAELADHLGASNPIILFDQFVDSLDSRKQDLFLSRICKPTEPDTLDAIAERWGVTKERVRQIEGKVKEQAVSAIGKVFNRFAIPFFNQYRGKIVRHKLIHVASRSLTAGSTWSVAASGFALATAGRWKKKGDWVLFNENENLHDSLVKLLEEQSDHFGLVGSSKIQDPLDSFFLAETDRDAFLGDVLNIRKFGDYWCKDTKRNQAVAALLSIGCPTTKEEISVLMDDYAINKVGSLLSSIDGIVRADRDRWGLEEWVEDEYTGIVDEIHQRLEEDGGTTTVHRLITEIPAQFGVSEASVRSYLSTDAFEIGNGMVSIADTSEFSPKAPSSVSRSVSTSEGWGQVMSLTRRNFEGQSLGVSFDLAYANGLRPNDDLEVEIGGTSEIGTLIWRPTTTSRRIDVGRLSRALRSLGFEPGDQIAVVPTRNQIILLNPELLEELGLLNEFADDTDEEEDELIFGESEHHDLLTDVIPDERGDNE